MRTALFVPGSSPRMMEKSRGAGADVVVFDLEDAVSPAQKPEARERVVAELRSESGHGRWVRVNPVDSDEHRRDIRAVAEAAPDAILLPKADPASLSVLDAHLNALGSDVPVVALVETCRGLLEIADLCRVSARLVGLQLGAEDLTAELAVARTTGGEEIRFARQQVAVAARANGLFALDTPNLGLGDPDALRLDTIAARACGMTGKTCIHPSQLAVVAEAFRSDAADLEWADAVVAAAAGGAARGEGAVALDGRMIDAPVLARARRIIAEAREPHSSTETDDSHHDKEKS